MIDKFVIVRCRDAGVHCGTLVSYGGRAVELSDARRIHFWRGANTLNEMSVDGCAKESRISKPVASIILLDACEIIPCTVKAQENLQNSRWTE